ncbi:MAG: hypothetical protein HC811_02255 [Flammeovirgaceae bacterium]|nr:hypothetical protein [Flammeovirgaceae bacterium]
MKIILQSLVLFVILGGLITFTSCGDDPPSKTQEEIQLELLAKTWQPISVELDGVDKTTDYSSFSLTLSGTAGSAPYSYTTSGRPTLSPWPSSGTWDFGTDLATQLVRDPSTADERDMTYQVSDTQFQLTFQFSGPGYSARTSNVTGTWVLLLVYNQKDINIKKGSFWSFFYFKSTTVIPSPPLSMCSSLHD